MTSPREGSGEATGDGTVLEATGGVYQVLLHPPLEGVVEAFLRGRLKQERRTGSRVVAGDRVRLAQGEDGTWTVEAVVPRRSELVRAGPGGHKPKVVAANLDRVVVVVSADDPPLREEQVDRFLALAESCGVEGVLVVNKADLPGAPAVLERVVPLYREIGYEVLPTSAVSRDGLDALTRLLQGETSALVGPSGAGKSSLLNALDPNLSLRVGELSRRSRSGRHTTVGARLLLLPADARVVDTPGFSDVTLWGMEPETLREAFREFAPLADECRFRGCSHVHEPGCAVREAVEAGTVHKGRYRSYLLLQEEA